MAFDFFVYPLDLEPMDLGPTKQIIDGTQQKYQKIANELANNHAQRGRREALPPLGHHQRRSRIVFKLFEISWYFCRPRLRKKVEIL